MTARTSGFRTKTWRGETKSPSVSHPWARGKESEGESEGGERKKRAVRYEREEPKVRLQ